MHDTDKITNCNAPNDRRLCLGRMRVISPNPVLSFSCLPSYVKNTLTFSIIRRDANIFRWNVRYLSQSPFSFLQRKSRTRRDAKQISPMKSGDTFSEMTAFRFSMFKRGCVIPQWLPLCGKIRSRNFSNVCSK